MEHFALNKEFNDFQSVLAAKKSYENSTNTLLVVISSKKLIGDSETKGRLIFEKIIYGCKAGQERPTRSNGIRASSTYKKGCEVKIRLAIKNDKLYVKEANLTHQNHGVDKATFDHYPENMRIKPEKLKDVEKMIELPK